MDEVPVKDWQEFFDTVAKIRRDYCAHERPIGGKVLQSPNTVLFRGEPPGADPLTTTLERRSGREPWHVGGYLTVAAHYVSSIESYSGERFNFPDGPERDVLLAKQDFMRVVFPGYNYLAFLRHYGFPSPFLDWTESPFIAAYFAYCDGKQGQDCTVYCFIETTNGVTSGTGGVPDIHVLGPHVTADKRHFDQKSWYTVATRWDEATKRPYFCPHMEVFSQKKQTEDLLFTIRLPGKERANILGMLDDFNINHYTLFHTTDALARAMGSREFDIGEHCDLIRSSRLITPSGPTHSPGPQKG